MQFAQSLKRILNEKGITKYRLAKELGVHQTTVKNWLDGKTEPKFETIEKIAFFLNVTPSDLFNDNYDYFGADQEEAEKVFRDYFKEYTEYQKNIHKRIQNGEIQQIRDEIFDAALNYKDEPLSDQAIMYKDTITKYNSLNTLGKNKANEYITDLSEQEKYTKPDNED